MNNYVSSLMAEVTIALGVLMRHLPVDKVIVTRDSVTVHVPGAVAFAQWQHAVNGRPYNVVHHLACEGDAAGVRLFVLTADGSVAW